MKTNTPLDNVLRYLRGKRPRTLIRCVCGSTIEMRNTRGHNPMIRPYCPLEDKFLQMKHLTFPIDVWPGYGIVIEILLQLDREQAKGVS